MKDQIVAFEKISRLLEPSVQDRKQWSEQLQGYLNQFFKNNDDPNEPLFYDKAPVQQSYDDFQQPISFDAALHYFQEKVIEEALNPASGRHFGYIPGGGIYASAIGDYLGAATNKYVGLYSVAPNAVQIENNLIAWMADLMGFDKENAGGSLTSGGSMANLTGIVAARDAKLSLKDYHRAVIYMTDQTHHCVHKALRIAGFIANEAHQIGNIHYIEMDGQYNLKIDKLEEAIQKDKAAGKLPFMVVGNAGTTNFGSVDPLYDIGKICEKEALWFHVDGAYGAYFMLSDYKAVLKGIELADTVVMDAHKTLFLPYGLGALIAKNKADLFNAFYYQASYIDESNDLKYSPANVSPELTKPFRGLRLWLPLKLHGVAPFAAALNEKILLARYFYQQLSDLEGFKLSPFPQLSVFAFRYIPSHLKGNETAINQYNQQKMNEIVRAGEVFFSGTMDNGQFWIRVAVVVFRTHLVEVDRAISVIKKTFLLPNISDV